MQLLLLAGSSEATQLAERLGATPDLEVISSFAGRTTRARQAHPPARVGGFGGAGGLARWLAASAVDAVVDATHPFAARMPQHAADACTTVGLPRLRVCRPAWTEQAGDQWLHVLDLAGAAAALETLGARRVLLTTGRQELQPFAQLHQMWFLVRSIEHPDPLPLEGAQVLLARGPFGEDAERELMVEHDIDAVVTKNSGGTATAAKLAAARALGLPVVMVTRPPTPAGPVAETVDQALAWCRSTLGGALV